MDCDCFVLSIETQIKINDLKNLEDLFDSSNLNENHELYKIKKKNVVGKRRILRSFRTEVLGSNSIKP